MTAFQDFIAADWYWIVNDDEAHPYSSARARYVESADNAYLAFRLIGKTPTRINSENELVDVLLAAYPPGAPVTAKSAQFAIEAHVNATAVERGYSSAVSCASYAASTNPLWQAEALAFIAWRDAIWAYAFQALSDVQTGQREKPSMAELLAELPQIEWTN